ncbi:MAG: hypothetical protein FJZ00_02255, partial [Candidatus Sericytochromatia bacterium]|nr:hypothetical protein [Candidatus Tanganyikabacteria bacterium]
METSVVTTVSRSEQEQIRLEKVAAMREAGIEPYPCKFERTAMAADLQTRYADL